MAQQRIHYIDVAKGLGILLVVFGHAVSHGAGINKTFWWIYSFHMPLFFFLSGMVFKRKDRFFEKRVTSLIIPTIFCWTYNIVMFLILYVVGLSGYYNLFNIGTYWFLLALFCISVGYYLVDMIVSGKNRNTPLEYAVKAIIACVFLVAGLLYSKKIGGTIDIMTASFVGFFYYALGSLYAEYIKKENKESHNEDLDVPKLKWGGYFADYQ